MNNQNKVFFILDKWCAGNKKFGPSEWETNLWTSLKTSKLAEVEIFNFDEFYENNKKLGDEELLNKINSFKPSIIFLVIYKMPGSDTNLPTWATLKKIKYELKIPMVAIWGDLEIKEQIKISKALLPYTLFNIATASSAAVKRIRNDKYYYMWVPKDSKYFYNPQKERDIKVSYVGSQKPDRIKKIMYLINNGVSVVYGGGERQEHKSINQYADIYQRSEITISFSRAHLSHVVNARPFEAMSCGAMLLEQDNFELPKLYIPFIDYVPYKNNKDLLKKVKYYLDNRKEREDIANNGWKKTSSIYSAENFWKIILDKVFSKNNSTSILFDYKLDKNRLLLLSSCHSLKLRTLNKICSSNIPFHLFIIFNWQLYISKALIFSNFMKNVLQKILPSNSFEYLLQTKRKMW